MSVSIQNQNDGFQLSRFASYRIGFSTSIKGVGGSEVIFFDSIRVAIESGAYVICWCPPGAHVRTLAARYGVSSAIEFRDWPYDAAGDGAGLANEKSLQTGPSRAVVSRLLWRNLFPASIRRIIGFRRDAKKFEREIRESQVDFVFVNVNGSEAAVVGARHARIRTLGCYHLSVAKSSSGLFSRFIDWIQQAWSMHCCDKVVHVSVNVRDQWCRRCFYPVAQTKVIHNGVPVDELRRRCSPADLSVFGCSPDTVVFCCPARLHPMKGHRYIIDAVALHREALKDAMVLCCGDGNIHKELCKYAELAGVADMVKFIGHRNDLHAIISASVCIVLPSIASENLSIAVLEAAALGVPSIVTDVGGMSEALVDGETGVVVPPGDANALGKAMVRIAGTTDRTAMGKAAEERVREFFSLKRMETEYSKVFSEALAKTPRS